MDAIDLNKYFAKDDQEESVLSNRYKGEYDKQFQNKNKEIPPTKISYAEREKNLRNRNIEYQRTQAFQSDPINIGQQVINAGESKYNEDMPGNIYTEDDYLNKINDYRSNQQSGIAKAGDLAIQFIGKTALNTIGGVGGFVYGLGSALVNKDASKIIDNDVLDLKNSLDKFLTENMPVYVNSKASWYNPAKLGTTIVDTYSFIAGAVLTEMLTAGLGSAAVGVKGAQLLNKFTKVDDVIKGIAKVGSKANISKNLNAARQIVTGSFWESVLESNSVLKETAANSLDNFIKVNGRPPTEDEYQEIVDNSIKAGFGTLAMNMGILNVSRAAQFPAIFGTKFQGSKLLSKLTDNVVDKEVKGLVNFTDNVAKRVEKTGISKFADNTWKIMKNPLTEGVWEEGNQGIVSKAMTNYYTTGYDKDSIDKNSSLIKSFSSAIKDEYSPEGGITEMIIGALVGSIGAPGRGLVPGKYGKKQIFTDENGNKIGGEKYDKWGGGIYGEFREAKNKAMLADKYIEMANNAPKNLGYAITEQVQAGVRAGKINKDMITI